MNNLHLAASTRARTLGGAVNQTFALVLAGGRGERLHGLTDRQAKPALHFGGRFRMVDFPLSNCINSNIRRIAIATQYRAHELIHHVQRTWGFLRPELSEFVELWPAQQQNGNSDWYAGTADAVYQNIELLRHHAPRYVLILAGDHVYKQDYRYLIADHIESGADVTISCVEVPREDGQRFGVMNVDGSDFITHFLEKPANPPGLADDPSRCLASTGIYLFNADVLLAALRDDANRDDSTHDFGRDIIPALLSQYRVGAHRLSHSCVVSAANGREAYWRDVGTIDAYWQANMELVWSPDMLNLYDENWRIWSHQENCAPVRFVSADNEKHAIVTDSIVGNGCVVHGAYVRCSVLSPYTEVSTGAQMVECVVLPHCEIGADARLHLCILAEDCKIPAGLVVGEDDGADNHWFHRTAGGVTVITPAMLARWSAQRTLRVAAHESVPRVRLVRSMPDVA
jgi:glucose-1-phosphate adenylyltransferase